MQVVCFDTETCLFRAGVMAPELVCVTYQIPGCPPNILHVKDSLCYKVVRAWLEADCVLAGHHVVYDLAVVGAQWPDLAPLIFAKYDRSQITCTKIRQQLLDIAAGEFRGKFVEVKRTTVEDDGQQVEVKTARWVPHNYSLDDLIYRAAGRRLDKDTWRMRYGEFINTPLEQWPEGARLYPLEDARATLDVYRAQEEHVQYIPDQYRQAAYAWARHLTSVWGLRTHGPGVDALEAQTVAALAQIEDGLKEAGLVRHDGTKDTKKAKERMVNVCAREGITLRLTDGGAPSLDSDACEASGDELLEDYADLTSLKKVLGTDIPILRSGTEHPIHTSFGMAASGRSTSAKPNVQNPRRLPGIREAFVPRSGKVFAQADFSALELHTLAQVCVSLFGNSELARVLNAGMDPHTDFAANILGITYEEAQRLEAAGDTELDNARQTAKVANFGFPGGLGFAKLVLFARKSYGVKLTESQAKDLKAAWVERWPELQKFFAHAGKTIDEDSGLGTIKQLFSERWRGGCHYTALCNTLFQGLGADAASRAHYLVAKACYSEPSSVLFGSRMVNFVHDEIILEVDDDNTAHDKAVELGRLMIQGANEFLPDVPSKCKPLLARCWSKKSKPIKDITGRLVPWDKAL